MSEGVYRATIQGTCAGVAVDNILGFRSDAESDHAGLISAAGIIIAAWGTYMMAHLSTEYVLTGIMIRSLTDPTSGADVANSASGSTSVSLLPLFACAKVNWRTPLVGRAYRGRTGLVGLGEVDTDPTAPNAIRTSSLSALQNDAEDFRSHLATNLTAFGNGWKQAVVSTVSFGAPRVPPLATPVTGVDVGRQLGTRRSRLT